MRFWVGREYGGEVRSRLPDRSSMLTCVASSLWTRVAFSVSAVTPLDAGALIVVVVVVVYNEDLVVGGAWWGRFPLGEPESSYSSTASRKRCIKYVQAAAAVDG